MRWRESAKSVAQFLLIALAVVAILPFLGLYAVFRLVRGLWLRARFVGKWRKDGKRVLLVYSDSPNWQRYIEQALLPKVAPHAVTLNYSRRGEWKHSKPLEAKVWSHWAGEREFNPMAIFFPRLRRVRIIRFYQAFRDLKHGNDRLLRQKERELFDLVSDISQER